MEVKRFDLERPRHLKWHFIYEHGTTVFLETRNIWTSFRIEIMVRM